MAGAAAGAGAAVTASAATSRKGSEANNNGLVSKTRQRGMSIASRISRISSRIAPAVLIASARNDQNRASEGAVLEESKRENALVAPAASCKDEYSEDVLENGSLVAVVWSYQPQTLDEYALERGDMLEIVGIWNDRWATGRLLSDRVDVWEHRKKKHDEMNETSSNGDGLELDLAQTTTVKAFPLVCVCSAPRWRDVIQKYS